MGRITAISNFIFDGGTADEKKHDYFYIVDDRQFFCQSVTSLLSRHGLAKDFSANPIMASNAERAAARGTEIHETVSRYFKGGCNDQELSSSGSFEAVYAVNAIKNLLYSHGIRPEGCASGLKFHSEKSMCILYRNGSGELPLGGTADFVFTTDDKTAYLVDLKTGDRHPESELWQLSMYSLMIKYTMGLEVKGAYIVHSQHTKSKTSHKTVDMTHNLVNESKIQELFDLEISGGCYKKSIAQNAILIGHIESEQRLLDFLDRTNFYALQAEKEKLEKDVETAAASVETVMRENGLMEMESNDYVYRRCETVKNELDLNEFVNSLTETENAMLYDVLLSNFKGFTEKEKAELAESCPKLWEKYELAQMTRDAVKTRLTVKSLLDDKLKIKAARKTA